MIKLNKLKINKKKQYKLEIKNNIQRTKIHLPKRLERESSYTTEAAASSMWNHKTLYFHEIKIQQTIKTKKVKCEKTKETKNKGN